MENSSVSPTQKIDWPAVMVLLIAHIIVCSVKEILDKSFDDCKSKMNELAQQLYSLPAGTPAEEYTALGAAIGDQACQLLRYHKELMSKYATPEQAEKLIEQVRSDVQAIIQKKQLATSLPSAA